MLRSLVRVAVLAIATTVILLASSSGKAQGISCGDHETIVKLLAQVYSEHRTAVGLDQMGRVVELLTAPSGSWTVITTAATGLTCVVAFGPYWETIATTENGPVS